MDPPDMLDLEGLRSNGPQPGEQMQPQEDEQHQPAGRQLSERRDGTTIWCNGRWALLMGRHSLQAGI